ncbi:hydrogenase formation protein HypD [Natronogracilivirga saccharolytica]|uniref:Hydrogenase formation protein HypD n=1 Tax=Natronogracilivirga saccharolytica TaxID=2812953 RepID=A0A8J7UUR4_9BACT|nr:hydrogenase formation protein HypD [Natronogracilivirga saccharolytica]
MKYIKEYRDKDLVHILVERINAYDGPPVRFMEVCGGHTMAIQKFGIPSLLPDNVSLVSGPGCPVCVTSLQFVDHAIALGRRSDVIITTYGDLIRVPGSSSSLEQEKSRGSDIRMVYSTLEALAIARDNPSKNVVFLGIGFETTSPASAVALTQARRENLSNFYLLSAHKVMPPAMAAIVDENVKISGYLAPGHVSTITGSEIYRDIAEKYSLPVVVSGFEPADILQSIHMLLEQRKKKRAGVEIQYMRVVKPEGNRKAQALLDEVFEYRDDWWRGLGVLPLSGLGIREEFASWDAGRRFEVEVDAAEEPEGCICGDVLKGVRHPSDCILYDSVCDPANPVGTCMVSEEGACHAFYKYGSQ